MRKSGEGCSGRSRAHTWMYSEWLWLPHACVGSNSPPIKPYVREDTFYTAVAATRYGCQQGRHRHATQACTRAHICSVYVWGFLRSLAAFFCRLLFCLEFLGKLFGRFLPNHRLTHQVFVLFFQVVELRDLQQSQKDTCGWVLFRPLQPRSSLSRVQKGPQAAAPPPNSRAPSSKVSVAYAQTQDGTRGCTARTHRTRGTHRKGGGGPVIERTSPLQRMTEDDVHRP